MTDLIYTRFVFITQENQNDIRYSIDMNIYNKNRRNVNEK